MDGMVTYILPQNWSQQHLGTRRHSRRDGIEMNSLVSTCCCSSLWHYQLWWNCSSTRGNGCHYPSQPMSEAWSTEASHGTGIGNYGTDVWGIICMGTMNINLINGGVVWHNYTSVHTNEMFTYHDTDHIPRPAVGGPSKFHPIPSCLIELAGILCPPEWSQWYQLLLKWVSEYAL